MGKFFKFLFKIGVFALILPWIYALFLWVFNPPITITQIGSLIDGYGLKRDYVDASEMPANAFWAVVAAEDQKFANHNGFDIEGIKKALEKNQKSEKVRGASTISQQLAKNVFLWQGRSWLRKGLETYCTFVIETVLSKQRILELYLNVAEMGKGTFGIEAAAQYYFKKSAKDLNTQEISRIVAALPSPKKYNVNPPSGYIVKRGSWIQRQIKNLKSDPELQSIISGEPSKK